jgi:hypothetical protein
VARINRRFIVGAITAVLGFHTLLLGGALLFFGTQRVVVFGALTAGTGVLFVGGGLWRAIGAWGADGTDGSSAERPRSSAGNGSEARLSGADRRDR